MKRMLHFTLTAVAFLSCQFRNPVVKPSQLYKGSMAGA